MKLEQNGKSSSGKRTRHFNIKYFFMTDLIKRKEMVISYCPTEQMYADYMTKPTVGTNFFAFRNVIMKIDRSDSRSVLDPTIYKTRSKIKIDKSKTKGKRDSTGPRKDSTVKKTFPLDVGHPSQLG